MFVYVFWEFSKDYIQYNPTTIMLLLHYSQIFIFVICDRPTEVTTFIKKLLFPDIEEKKKKTMIYSTNITFHFIKMGKCIKNLFTFQVQHLSLNQNFH